LCIEKTQQVKFLKIQWKAFPMDYIKQKRISGLENKIDELEHLQGSEGKGGSRGKGGEMTQTLYAYMNKRKKFTKKIK
jgi:hypothetical protein